MLAKKESNKFKDLRTDKRIHEHLRNQHDHISEEDINNVKTDFIESGDTGQAIIGKETLAEEVETGEKSKQETDVSTSPGIETPWNLIE